MKISIKAILAGFFTSFVVIVIKIITSYLFYSSDYTQDISDENKQTLFSYLVNILQFLSYLAGGYVAAWVARKSEVIHGLSTAVFYFIVQSIFTYLFLLSKDLSLGLYQYLMGFSIVVIGFTLGAYIRKRISDKELMESGKTIDDKIENLGKDDPSKS